VTSFLKAINIGMYVLREDETFVRTANRNTSDVATAGEINMSEPTMMRSDGADWDPFNGEEAPEGTIFLGYISALLGPACVNPLHYSPLLKSNADSNQSVGARKEQSRATLRKNMAREENVERQDRKNNAITMQTNCDIATISLAKQESQERAADRQLLLLTRSSRP
jgi:hypothetical protein